MRFNIFPLIAFMSLVSLAARASDEVETVIAIRSKISIDNTGTQNIDHSHLEVLVHNARQSFQSFLDNIERQPVGSSMWEVGVRISAVPFLLRESVGEKVLVQVRDEIDHKFSEVTADTQAQIAAAEAAAYQKLAAGKAEALSQVGAITDAKLAEIAATNPALAQAIQYQNQSPAAKAAVEEATAKIEAAVRAKIDSEIEKNRALIESTIAETKRSAATQLDEAYQQVIREQIARINERLDRIQTETTLQEVAIRYVRKVSANRAVYMQVGKISPELGLSYGPEHRTYIENLRGGRDIPTALSGPHSTAGINVGMVQNLTFGNGQDMRVKLDTFIYKDRTSFIDGNDFIATLLSLSDEDFEDHMDIGNLDSGMVRLMVETEKVAAFVSGAFSANGEHHSIAAGVEWKITPLTRLTINGYTGDRVQASDAVSVFLSREITPSLTIYGGYTRTSNRQNSLVSHNSYNSQEWVVGASKSLPELNVGWVFSNVRIGIEAYTEQRDFGSSTSSSSNADQASGIRVMYSSTIGALSPEERLGSLQRKKDKLLQDVRDINERLASEELSDWNRRRLERKRGKAVDEIIKTDRKMDTIRAEIDARDAGRRRARA
jgi:hypothetical protein